tara:strand:+ start:6570 stop:7871 length:1302 start_codon:yes stop_codon:yes gene_type:complete
MTHIVIGLGDTGLSVVRFLMQQGITPYVMDTRMQPPMLNTLQEEFPDVPYQLGELNALHLAQAQQVVISPGMPLSHPALQSAIDHKVDIVGDIELFARAVQKSKAKVVGITGSNGKSTVTTLVSEILTASGLRCAIGGNIGIPALSLLDDHIDVYVLELSSFQLETTKSLNCDISVVLNISHDHQDRYPHFEAYRQAKLKLYQQSKNQLIHYSDPLVQDASAKNPIFFNDQCHVRTVWYIKNNQVWYHNIPLCPVESFKLMGAHNHLNYVAAMALAQHVGATRSGLLKATQNFKGLAHRFQWVCDQEGVRYINDSKATNVGATLAALEGLKSHTGRLILIAGGDAKQADLSPLQPALQHVSLLIALGQDGAQLAQLSPCSKQVETMKEAVDTAAKHAKQGDIILLSPACASWDMYPNFMVRGDDFCQCIEVLR